MNTSNAINRAILFADWHDFPAHASTSREFDSESHSGFSKHFHHVLGYGNPGLLPLLEKTALQRSIEHLAHIGVKTIDLFVDMDPAAIRQLVSDGERWGLSINMHYFDVERPLNETLRRLQLLPQEQVWISSAQSLPVDHKILALHNGYSGEAYWQMNTTPASWCGWATLTGQTLERIDTPTEMGRIGNCLLQTDIHNIETEKDLWLQTHNTAVYLKSQQNLLLAVCEQTGNAQHISRKARVHPLAIMGSPIYVGPHAVIGAGARIGALTVIGEKTIIGDNTIIKQSLVLPNTIVSTDLTITRSIVSSQNLIRAEEATHLLVDHALIGSTKPGSLRSILRHRLTAILSWLLMIPLFVIFQLAFKLSRRQRISIMRSDYPYITDFCERVYPGIRQIWQVRTKLFGAVGPMNFGDQSLMPGMLLDNLPPGLLNERALASKHLDMSEAIACDAMAAAGLSISTKARILYRYILGTFQDLVSLMQEKSRKSNIQS